MEFLKVHGGIVDTLIADEYAFSVQQVALFLQAMPNLKKLQLRQGGLSIDTNPPFYFFYGPLITMLSLQNSEVSDWSFINSLPQLRELDLNEVWGNWAEGIKNAKRNYAAGNFKAHPALINTLEVLRFDSINYDGLQYLRALGWSKCKRLHTAYFGGQVFDSELILTILSDEFSAFLNSLLFERYHNGLNLSQTVRLAQHELLHEKIVQLLPQLLQLRAGGVNYDYYMRPNRQFAVPGDLGGES